MSNDYTRKAIIEFLDESPSIDGRTVLDYGCGDGWGTLELQRHGAIAMAFDIDVNAGGLLKDSGIKFFRNYLSLMSRKFDVIFCHHMLEHVYEPLEVLIGLRFLLHDDSELWLSVPNFAVNNTYCEGHVMPYSMPVLIEHLRQAGYDTANGSYLITHPSFGHLRVRIRGYKGFGMSDYPEPMKEIMQTDHRVDNKHLTRINWSVK